jgi:hypothetical protein
LVLSGLCCLLAEVDLSPLLGRPSTLLEGTSLWSTQVFCGTVGSVLALMELPY